MHELSVTESILEISLRHAKKVDAKRITNLYLVIGQLASIVDDSVQFYTIADGSKLHFRRIPATLMCKECDNQFTPDGSGYECPKCKGSNIKIISGEEFFMEAIDVET
jgi:hydrogenase nickel incorporation protein HypA/HybF